MPKIDLLQQWYQHGKYISSPFLIMPTLSRDTILRIYDKLLSAFGELYFIIEARQEKSIEKTNWLFGLLAKKQDINSIAALQEVAELIGYLESLEDCLKKDFNDLKKNPPNLRNFFFELYIYRLLDQHCIPNNKKPWIGNQPVEGICVINEKEFLFECRKAYIPDMHRIDIPRRIAIDFETFGRETPPPTGIICTITFNLPLRAVHRDHYLQTIKRFFKLLRSDTISYNPLNYTVQNEFGVFQAINYDIASLIEVKNRKNYDVLFYARPVGELSEFILLLPRAEYSFRLEQQKVNKKVESILKEKRDQHRNSPYEHKIIFIDSESLSEFQMGLFQDESMFDMEVIKGSYEKLCLDSIIFFTRRSFRGGTSRVLVDAIYPAHLEQEAKAVGNIFK